MGRTRETRRPGRGTVATAIGLACAAFAAQAAASTPPPKALLVDVTKGSVGGLVLGQPPSAFVRSFGLPDYSGTIEPKRGPELLWSRSTSTSAAWAVATLQGPGVVEELRYGGLFRTANGDRPGISLATFRRHWAQVRLVHPIVRNGITVEYNVIVGRVAFAFDESMKLRAVALAPVGRAASLCLIPYVCVTSSLG